MLDGLEIINWFEALEHGATRSSRCDESIKRARNDSEMDGDKKTGTKTELIQFILRMWNTERC